MFASLLAASTSNRYFLLEQTGQVSFPLGEKNSLESKNSVCVCVCVAHLARQRVQALAKLPKESHPPQNRALFRLFERLRRAFHRFFPFFFLLFFVVSIQLLRFTATIVPHFPCDTASCTFETTVNDFESAQGWGGEGRGQYSSRFFADVSLSPLGGTLRWDDALETEIENSSDARQGNPWNSSVWLCFEYFSSKDVNLDTIFPIVEEFSSENLRGLFVKKKKEKYEWISRELLSLLVTQDTIREENLVDVALLRIFFLKGC